MKKILIARITCVTLVVVVSTMTVMAQERQSPLQRYGVKAGLQSTRIPPGGAADDWEIKVKSSLGFQVGGFATFGLSDDFSIQTELFLSVQRYSETLKINVGTEIEDAKSNYSDRYLKLPVLLRYQVAEKFFLEAGPQFAFFVSSKIEKNEWVHFKKFSTAAALGAEYLVSENLSIQIRYAHNLAKIEDVDNYIWLMEKPHVLSLGVAYAF